MGTAGNCLAMSLLVSSGLRLYIGVFWCCTHVHLRAQVRKGEHFVLVTGWDSNSSQVWAVNGMPTIAEWRLLQYSELLEHALCYLHAFKLK